MCQVLQAEKCCRKRNFTLTKWQNKVDFAKFMKIINPLVPVGYEICNSQLDTSHWFLLDMYSSKNRFFLEGGQTELNSCKGFHGNLEHAPLVTEYVTFIPR